MTANLARMIAMMIPFAVKMVALWIAALGPIAILLAGFLAFVGAVVFTLLGHFNLLPGGLQSIYEQINKGVNYNLKKLALMHVQSLSKIFGIFSEAFSQILGLVDVFAPDIGQKFGALWSFILDGAYAMANDILSVVNWILRMVGKIPVLSVKWNEVPFTGGVLNYPSISLGGTLASTGHISVSYTHLRAPRDRTRSRMPSSA